jgi:FkbM family methyltransferase
MLTTIVRRTGSALIHFSRMLDRRKHRSRLIARGGDRDLYETRSGQRFWLNPTLYVDKCLVDHGVFEEKSSSQVCKLIKPGDTVIDVGANIGYYTVMMANLVGPNGRVIAFEPTKYYGDVLRRNLEENNIRNVQVLPLGLSDRRQKLWIDIANSSATLHTPGGGKSSQREEIELVTLDELFDISSMPRLDFVKVDIDGHEPLFLRGAWGTLNRCSPTVLMEVNALNYREAGFDPAKVYDELRQRGFFVYDEDSLKRIDDSISFLIRCGNYAYSSNVFLSRRSLP